ncbi:MAG: nuclear transport factor 2 family protein [Chitinophagales bacterium]|nr:nuclear transport factor 2 family protein [Chitinophagales bacterium]
MKSPLMIILFLFSTFSFNLFAQSSEVKADSEMEAIESVLMDYMMGGTERDTERLVSAFHPQAMMKYIKNGTYHEVNAREFFGGGKPGPRLERTNEILSLEVSGYVAFAKLRLKYKDKQFLDFMTLMKIDGKWSIINKTFYVEKF